MKLNGIQALQEKLSNFSFDDLEFEENYKLIKGIDEKPPSKHPSDLGSSAAFFSSRKEREHKVENKVKTKDEILKIFERLQTCLNLNPGRQALENMKKIIKNVDENHVPHVNDDDFKLFNFVQSLNKAIDARIGQLPESRSFKYTT